MLGQRVNPTTPKPVMLGQRVNNPPLFYNTRDADAGSKNKKSAFIPLIAPEPQMLGQRVNNTPLSHNTRASDAGSESK